MKYVLTLISFLVFSAITTINTGCTSHAKKDLFIKMRPPTSEAPYFQKERGFGFHFDVESQRIMMNPTSNLVDNFNFNNNSFYEGSKTSGIAGLDFAGLYTRPAFGIPIEYELSLDYAHLKFQLLDARTDGKGPYITGNFGLYSSSIWTDSGECSSIFLCFQNNRDTASAIENSIKVSANGRERKWGLSAGYYFDPRRAVFIAHNWYEDNISMTASRSTGDPIEIRSSESVHGKSYGIGYLYVVDDRNMVSVIVDNFDLSWRRETIVRTNVGVHFNVAFQ